MNDTEEMEIEMDCEPANHLHYECSGTTFTVHLVMEDQDISQRSFKTESEAIQCMVDMCHILGKSMDVAIQEFQK